MWNQFDEAYSVNELAELASQVATEQGLHPTIEHPPDPRVEAESHYYHPLHDELPARGYRRTRELGEALRQIFADLTRFRRRLEARRHVVMLGVNWRSGDNRASIARRTPRPQSSPHRSRRGPRPPRPPPRRREPSCTGC